MHGVVCMDDFVFHKSVEWQTACLGLAGGCPACLRGLAVAEVLDEWWIDLCDQLGVPGTGDLVGQMRHYMDAARSGQHQGPAAALLG